MDNDYKALLLEWQTRLGLLDWRLWLNTDCKAENMTIKDSSGDAEWTESNKTARIDILSNEEYGDRITQYDPEETLVHELLHLKFSIIEDGKNDTQSRCIHQLVDDMARALVCAKRGTLQMEIKHKEEK